MGLAFPRANVLHTYRQEGIVQPCLGDVALWSKWHEAAEIKFEIGRTIRLHLHQRLQDVSSKLMVGLLG